MANDSLAETPTSIPEVTEAGNDGSMTEGAVAENNHFTSTVTEATTTSTEVAERTFDMPKAGNNGFMNGVVRSATKEVVAGNNSLMNDVARNDGFMTELLVLLKTNNSDFMKEVTSQACSATGQIDEVKQDLNLVEYILNQAGDFANDGPDDTRAKGNQGQSDSLTSPSVGTSVALSPIMNMLRDKNEALQTNGAQGAVESLLLELKSFPWGLKAVVTLLALSMYYVENWRCTEIQASDKVLQLLKNIEGLPTGTSSKIQLTKAFVNLIKETLAFTKCIVEFVSNYKDSKEILKSKIDISANFYYIIVIVLGCSVLFRSMISESNEFLEQDLSTFLKEVMTKHQLFNTEVQNFKQREDENLYQEIKEAYGSCTDIVNLLGKLFCHDNSSTVYQCYKRTKVTVEELKNKSVMLLISNLNLSDEDLETLTSIYNVSTFRSENYEIMWVPIMDAHDEVMEKQFWDLRSRMQWYSCNSMVSNMAAKFIQKKWQFTQQTKIVLLNQEGKVENMDAMTMIRLWGCQAFPFTKKKSCELWNMEGINWFKLVVNKTIYPFIEQCFERKDLLFLYDSAEDSNMVHEIEEYLEKINKSVSYIPIRISAKREQFLTLLESCISSKMEATSDVYDSKTQELFELYTSYKKHGGFAIIARGSGVVVNARLTDFATVLSQHQTLIKRVTQTKAFEAVFQEHYKQVIVKTHCHRFYIPNMVGNMPKSIECIMCSQNMKKTVIFECCHSEH